MNILLVLFGCIVASQAETVCYPPCGCFSDDPPFDDRDLPESPTDQELEYLLFTRDNPDTAINIDWDNVPPQFDPSKKTVFMAHGWNSGWERMQGIMDAMLKVAELDVQVIMIEWRWGATGIWYPACASNAQVSGACAGHLATRLHEDHSLPWDQMMCVGHSLGAHVCGYMGKSTQGQMGRVSGIDPAGPWFIDEDPRVRIDASDSQFTDVMHTNGDTFLGLGMGWAVGDADFYPNKGLEQPPCGGDIIPACDHNIGVSYYIHSISSRQCLFNAVPCNSDDDADQGRCSECQDPQLCQRMGYYADTMQGRGTFYLETVENAPFCKDN